jgi:pimeloyl-ACP methyl ester carboxylesterase
MAGEKTSEVISGGAYGIPIVVIPGIQGRWEWMGPAIDALSTKSRVVTFSLDEGGAPTFDDYVDQVDRAFQRAGIERAVVIGVSFGGLVAASYAARHPLKTAALILVVTPSPRWKPDGRVDGYVKHPWLSAPEFLIRACLNLIPEVVAAKPTWGSRLTFFASYLARCVRYPASPALMAERVRRWLAADVETACQSISAPTLVITGAADLDRVVPVADTLGYLHLIAGSAHVQMPRTGHIGLVSQPHEFTAIVSRFVDARVAAYDA